MSLATTRSRVLCLFALAAAVLALSGWPGAAGAQELAVGNSVENVIYVLDLMDGTIVRTIATDVPVSGLAADDASGLFYYTDGSELHSVSYTGATKVLIGCFDPVGDLMGGLAFDSDIDILWGTRFAPQGGIEGLYSVSVTNASSIPQLLFSPAETMIAGLAFDSAAGVLYGTNDDDTPGPTGVVIVDTVTDTLTLTAAQSWVDYGIVGNDVDGLAVHDGIAYLVEDQDDAGEAIHVVRISDGVKEDEFPLPWQIVGPVASSGAEVFIAPEPGAAASATTALLVLVGLARGSRQVRRASTS